MLPCQWLGFLEVVFRTAVRAQDFTQQLIHGAFVDLRESDPDSTVEIRTIVSCTTEKIQINSSLWY